MTSSKTELPAEQAEQQKPESASTARVLAVVVAVTLVAAALRLYKLGEWSFWVDEIFTLEDSIGHGALGKYHGMTFPLSYILIGATMQSLGVSEWSARLVPALFGIATPAMVYLLSRKSFGDLPSALAAGIIAISPWHLYWSQMARFYSMTVFFSTASVLVLYRGLETNRKGAIFLAGVLMVLGTISHYSALLMLGAAAAYMVFGLIFKWARPPGLSVANALIFMVPFVPGIVVAGAKAGSLLAKYAGGHPTGTTFADPIMGAAYMAVSTAYRLEPVVALLALVGLWIGLRRRDRGAVFLTIAVAVPIVFLIVCGAMSHAENRYAFVVLPAAALLAGGALSSVMLPVWRERRLLAVVIPLVAAIPLLQHDASYFGSVSKGERWNYKAAAQYLRSNAAEGDIVYSSMPYPVEYYLKDARFVVQDLNVGKDASGLPGTRAWIVMEDSTRGQSLSRDISSWLRTNCDLKASFPAGSPVANYSLSVYLYEGGAGGRGPGGQ